MNVRKLLDWRKLLIYSHRWLGIGITVMFLVWTLSGVVLMYYGHPQITTGERLLRLEPRPRRQIPRTCGARLPASECALRFPVPHNSLC